MPKRFYHAHVLPIFNYGVRIDSGANHSDFFSALSTDVHMPSDNIVMKLTNINPMNERIKFTECKKLK
jgi:hypothetical protein